MNSNGYAEVLVREGVQHGVATATPTTYPIEVGAQDQIDDLLPRIAAMRTELAAGNVESAVTIGHLVGGRAARLGQRRVAGLVRRALVMSRFYVLDQAGETLAQAEAELISKN